MIPRCSGQPSVSCPTAISDEFTIISQVGRGGYGSVYKAIEKSTGDIVALKKVHTFDNHSGLPLSYYREVNCLRDMKSDTSNEHNIINLRRVYRSKEEGCFYLVLDYCEYDLSGLIHTYGLTYNQKRSFMKQILLAISSMHRKGYVHRDLKPSNIFVTKDAQIKLGDFGLSRKLDRNRPLSPKVMTPSYRPPEVLLGDAHYDHSVDIWSLGCVFYEILTNKILFKPSTSSDISQLASIFQICGSPTKDNWPNFLELPNADFVKMTRPFEPTLRVLLEQTLPPQFQCLADLLEAMLQLDPSKRINVQQALSHPFFVSNNSTTLLDDDFVSSSSLSEVLTYPESHAMNVASAQLAAKNIIRMKKMKNVCLEIKPERVLPPPILA